jgi:hypothetical protein
MKAAVTRLSAEVLSRFCLQAQCRFLVNPQLLTRG